MPHILNNPVWQALSTRDKQFDQGNEKVKFFPSDVSPFVAMEEWNEEAQDVLWQMSTTGRKWFVMKKGEVKHIDKFKIVFTIPLYQMVCPGLSPSKRTDIVVRNLSDEDIPQMLELTAKTKPGPFLNRTIAFGNYIGIFENDQLVSMAGERLHVNGYSEISAVCTSPEHLGKGYAGHLMSNIGEKIQREGDIPFLHTRQDNTSAIKLYEKLGFRIREEIYFAIFEKV